MTKARLIRELSACTLAVAIAGTAPTVFADNDTPRRGSYGPGMMMGGAYGSGYGPGMMGGGYAPGYGGGGYGPGYGGGYVPERGWNGQRLTDQQLECLQEIQQKEQKKQYELMQKMQERQRELYRMQLADNPDYEAIKKKSREIGDLRQEMAQERIETQKRMEKALGEN